jgi:hypothetical protein
MGEKNFSRSATVLTGVAAKINVARLEVVIGAKLILAQKRNVANGWADLIDDPIGAYGMMSTVGLVGAGLLELGAVVVTSPILAMSSASWALLALQWFILVLPAAAYAAVYVYTRLRIAAWRKLPLRQQIPLGHAQAEVDISRPDLLAQCTLAAFALAVAGGVILAIINPFNQ